MVEGAGVLHESGSADRDGAPDRMDDLHPDDGHKKSPAHNRGVMTESWDFETIFRKYTRSGNAVPKRLTVTSQHVYFSK